MSRPTSKVTKVRVTGPLAPFAAEFRGRLRESGLPASPRDRKWVR